MKAQIMGRKLNLIIGVEEEEKHIKVRENLTINNLRAIIKRELKLKSDNTKIIHQGLELTGSSKMVELGFVDGDRVEIT